jgi:hypothetical protein
LRAGPSLKPVEPEGRAARQLARGLQRREPLEQPARPPTRQVRRRQRTRNRIVVEQKLNGRLHPFCSEFRRRRSEPRGAAGDLRGKPASLGRRLPEGQAYRSLEPLPARRDPAAPIRPTEGVRVNLADQQRIETKLPPRRG